MIILEQGHFVIIADAAHHHRYQTSDASAFEH
jgi:hypothetical protein